MVLAGGLADVIGIDVESQVIEARLVLKQPRVGARSASDVDDFERPGGIFALQFAPQMPFLAAGEETVKKAVKERPIHQR